MAIFGAPLPREDHHVRAVLAARQMVELNRLFNDEQEARDKARIEIGIGIVRGRSSPVIRARSTARRTPAWATPSTSRLVSSRTRRW